MRVSWATKAALSGILMLPFLSSQAQPYPTLMVREDDGQRHFYRKMDSGEMAVRLPNLTVSPVERDAHGARLFTVGLSRGFGFETLTDADISTFKLTLRIGFEQRQYPFVCSEDGNGTPATSFSATYSELTLGQTLVTCAVETGGRSLLLPDLQKAIEGSIELELHVLKTSSEEVGATFEIDSGALAVKVKSDLSTKGHLVVEQGGAVLSGRTVASAAVVKRLGFLDFNRPYCGSGPLTDTHKLFFRNTQQREATCTALAGVDKPSLAAIHEELASKAVDSLFEPSLREGGLAAFNATFAITPIMIPLGSRETSERSMLVHQYLAPVVQQ